jgi:hypothetical protein
MSVKYKQDNYLNKKDDVQLLYGIEVSQELIDGYKNMELNEVFDERKNSKDKRKNRIKNKQYDKNKIKKIDRID